MNLLEQCRKNVETFENQIYKNQEQITNQIISDLEKRILLYSEKGDYGTFVVIDKERNQSLKFSEFDSGCYRVKLDDKTCVAFILNKLKEHFENLGFITHSVNSDSFAFYVNFKPVK